MPSITDGKWSAGFIMIFIIVQGKWGSFWKIVYGQKRAEKNYCCIFMAKHSCPFHFLRFSSVCINSAWWTMLFCPKNRRWKRWQFISHPQHPVLYDIRKAPSHLRPSVRPPSVSMYNRYESTTMCVVYHHLPSLFMQCNISDPDAALYYQTQCLVNHLAADMTWHIKSRCCYYFICIVDIGFFHTLIFQAIILKRRPSTTYFKIKGTFICASSNNRKHPFMNSL